MNKCKVTDLRNKEIVESRSGCRLGTADDVEIDTVTARLISVIIYGRPKFFGLMGRYEELVIEWDHIELVGEDTILVDHCPSPKRRKSRFNFPVFFR